MDSEFPERPAIDAAMDRYAAGDDTAFAALYDGLAPRLYGYLLRQTRNVARAEDLVQQVMLQIHRARGSFIEGAAVVPWAFAIARRLLIDSIRKRRHDMLSPSSDDAQSVELTDTAGGPEELLRAKEMATRLRRALAKLPESQRTAFELVRQEGLSVAEAAEALGVTVTAVKLRAHRAYEALRAALGDVPASKGRPRE